MMIKNFLIFPLVATLSAQDSVIKKLEEQGKSIQSNISKNLTGAGFNTPLSQSTVFTLSECFSKAIVEEQKNFENSESRKKDKLPCFTLKRKTEVQSVPEKRYIKPGNYEETESETKRKLELEAKLSKKKEKKIDFL